MQLIPYLKANFGLDDTVLQQFDMATSTKKFTRKQIVLETGHYSKNVFFVESGLVRLFYYKGGRDITHFFFGEKRFLATSESVFYNNASIYGIEAVEDSIIRIIPYSLIEELAADSIAVNKLIQSILLESLVAFSSRLHALQFESAQERYHQLLRSNPDILLRAPLGDIASYLGVSQQTLSVIRSQRK
ncbi:Crp/Fnr family transcriptional regulator [Sphingobacterium sp. UT-1RO-CII-1]|uniref:Crp/Fnr family transcriptional regulator n=1 Tax=Sphingobacterium sp. UT-1RO-CII-1 TaxID=2995225 RepID=UPI00227D692C|nr:Crp/Fnr family transcriptional regulator [Sphingobacterium sp. UT-1RO-CII-1]MCY4779555.1 Crp/Fnr family transcriptional regulator [Sphingobacterium sp. UT-1RO-CII-1]